MQVPDIGYTRSGDVAIAYQTLGEGPVDVVWFRGMAGDLLSTWDQPLIRRHAVDLAEFSRLLMFDKRGTGLSDRVREVPTLEGSARMAALCRLLTWLGGAGGGPIDSTRTIVATVGHDQSEFGLRLSDAFLTRS